MTNNQSLIDYIKSHISELGVNIDCSRFEENYGGYIDSRDWFMRFNDNEISIDRYLEGLSENTLQKMKNSIDK